MATEKELVKISKLLSLVLRHKPETIGIRLDGEGWTDVTTLLRQLAAQSQRISREELEEVVRTNSKQRFAYNADRTKIRANQGHSVDVDLGYTATVPPAILYHGTGEGSVSSILKEGLVKGGRQQVHLSADIPTARMVGQRHGKPVIFEVAAGPMHRDGYSFYQSENGVWLTDSVPENYLRVISAAK